MSMPHMEPMHPTIPSEVFVDAGEAARFLKVNRRTLLQWSRQGVLPAHPLSGGSRKTWRFLLSELASWLRAQGAVN